MKPAPIDLQQAAKAERRSPEPRSSDAWDDSGDADAYDAAPSRSSDRPWVGELTDPSARSGSTTTPRAAAPISQPDRSSAPASSRSGIARITSVASTNSAGDPGSGVVEWMRASDERARWRAAEQGDVLGEGATLRTGFDTNVTLELPTGATIVVAPLTRVRIERGEDDRGRAGYDIILDRGAVHITLPADGASSRRPRPIWITTPEDSFVVGPEGAALRYSALTGSSGM